MRYVAAYLLSVLGGKENPNAADIEKVLSSVGIESDSEKLKTVISQLNGKSIDELVSKGQEKLATIPSGGGGGAAVAAAAPAAAGGGGGGGAASPSKKEAKEAKKEEPEEESDDDMGFGLFD